MIKTVLKEIIITLLLCIAIILILSVLFYDYNPINKIVPNKVEQYTTSASLKEELKENVIEYETTNVLYRVEGSDLNMYLKTNTYKQGKANPFEATSTGTTTTNSSNTSNGSSNGSSNANTNSNLNNQNIESSTNSDGTFWNSTKTK